MKRTTLEKSRRRDALTLLSYGTENLWLGIGTGFIGALLFALLVQGLVWLWKMA